MNIAIIPARGGSRRIPNKNIREFHGKPIIAYSIETARATGLFDHIYVSTDSDEIAKVAMNYGAEGLVRADEWARDEVGTQEVMRYELRKLIAQEIVPDLACCIYATAPLLSHIDLARGLAHLRKYNSAFAYGVDWLGNDIGQFYWGHTWAFVGEVPLHVDGLTTPVLIPPGRAIDINTPEDWSRAEQMYARLHNVEVA